MPGADLWRTLRVGGGSSWLEARCQSGKSATTFNLFSEIENSVQGGDVVGFGSGDSESRIPNPSTMRMT